MSNEVKKLPSRAIGHLFAAGDRESIERAIEELRPSIEASAGNLTKMSDLTGIPRRTLFRWFSERPMFAAAVESVRLHGSTDLSHVTEVIGK